MFQWCISKVGQLIFSICHLKGSRNFAVIIVIAITVLVPASPVPQIKIIRLRNVGPEIVNFEFDVTCIPQKWTLSTD